MIESCFRINIVLVFNVQNRLNDFDFNSGAFMKKDIHPPYQDVMFIDSATGKRFICGSTLQPKEFEEFEGIRYPIYRVAISSASHPFFTGSKQLIDSEGRVTRFQNRYKKKQEEKSVAPPIPLKKGKKK